MSRVVVTGGTGQVGRALIPLLDAAGHDVRVLSRRPGPGQGHTVVRADLVSGAGVADAMRDADVVVHLATTNGRRDVDLARTLVAALRTVPAAEGRPAHLIYLSIVGSDRIPLAYYRHKTSAEELAVASGLPVTVLRSTQFHTLVARLFASQRALPGLGVPAIPMQPIDVGEVAARLAELVAAPPAGRVPDIGGPQIEPLATFAAQWQRAHGRPARQLPLRVPGPTFAAYRRGLHTVPGPGFGTRTFADFLAHHG